MTFDIIRKTNGYTGNESFCAEVWASHGLVAITRLRGTHAEAVEDGKNRLEMERLKIRASFRRQAEAA